MVPPITIEVLTVGVRLTFPAKRGRAGLGAAAACGDNAERKDGYCQTETSRTQPTHALLFVTLRRYAATRVDLDAREKFE